MRRDGPVTGEPRRAEDGGASGRQARLAEAMRANLRRRKDQRRGRAAEEAGEGGGAAPEPVEPA